ncbi:hypothetical protein [Nocardia crassostreae]|uniref:hypothetical protein n=1 Tax=Nocardia crassostreae TaxID=53428 RepID=UPI00082F6913|nr:hypothetical protein [Nocardia crassostreae]
MSSIKSAFAITAASVGAIAFTIGSAAPSHAGPGGKFNTIYSLTQGPCVAVVDTSINGNAYPASAGFTVGANMIGVGSCDLTVTLHYRNKNNGATGTFDVHPHGPGYWMNSGPAAIVYLGAGSYTGWVTVNAASIGSSGQIDFDVP